ncbi:MAG: HEAT repeat domain-containing protein [Gemmatimonadales bacterium]|nr:HEAT repeat domain-containing protein [Gemmatimonadales bacterium]
MTRLAMVAALALVASAPLAAQEKAPRKDVVVKSKPVALEPSFQGRRLSEYVADLSSDSPSTRHHAAYAICGFGAAGAPAVPGLIKLLDDDQAVVRYPAAVCLGEIGPAAKDAIPALEKAVDDRSDDVGHMARKALKKIKGEG